MWFAAGILALAFVISVGLTPRVRALARRAGAIDHALSSRKVHGRPIPRLGGLAMVLGFAVAVAGAILAWAPLRVAALADHRRALAVAVGGVAVVLLGIYDDLRGARARHKFAVQFAVAGALYWAGVRIEQVDNPFGGVIALGWLSLPVTALWIAGVANAMNLIDGLDGLAGGIALAGAAAAFAIAAHAGDPIGMTVSAALAGAVAGFLVFNFNPASIFMGDTGSLFLGYVLAIAAIRPRELGAHDAPLIASVFALGIPIADTFLALSRRAARGAPLFRPDREHLHHLLLDRGLSHRAAVLIMWGAAAVFATAGVVLANGARGRGPVFVALVMLAAIALYAVGSVGRTSLPALLERRRANLLRLRAVQEAGRRLRQVAELSDVEEVLHDVAPALGARRIALHLGAPALAPTNTVPFGLQGERPGLGALAVVWSDGRPGRRDAEIAVELLCRHVAATVGRLEPAAPVSRPHWLTATIGAALVRGSAGRRVA